MYRQIKQVANQSETRHLLDIWPSQLDTFIRDVLTIQEIPAPSFQEQARANLIERRFKAIGLSDVFQDDIYNVYGRTPAAANAEPSSPAVLISAHLDTVFPLDTDLTIKRNRKHGQIFGPGVGDNSLGVAAMLGLAEAIQRLNIDLKHDIWWVATVCEEGLGDLRGIRQACSKLQDWLGVAIILEGIGLGRVYNAGLGARRFQIDVEGQGGHSWLHASRPSAIHHLMHLGESLLTGINVSNNPRSSFNIGLISGGTSINTRAAHATMSIDVRSTDRATLQAMESQLHQIIQAHSTPSLKTSIKMVGNRPNAALSQAHPLVAATRGVLNYVGCTASIPEIGSTDANIPLSEGIPTVCIGITTGGNAHTVDEFINISPIPLGMQQLSLLTMLAVEHADAWHVWDYTNGT